MEFKICELCGEEVHPPMHSCSKRMADAPFMLEELPLRRIASALERIAVVLEEYQRKNMR